MRRIFVLSLMFLSCLFVHSAIANHHSQKLSINTLLDTPLIDDNKTTLKFNQKYIFSKSSFKRMNLDDAMKKVAQYEGRTDKQNNKGKIIIISSFKKMD